MDNAATNIIALLIVGTSVMLLLAGAIIFFVIYYQKRMLQNKIATQELEADYQRQLLQSTIDSQEKERKRIASDLHDGVGAMLSAAKLNLNMLRSGTIPMEELSEAIGETKEMIDDTIDTVRRISKDLLPSSLEAFGLSKAVEELCTKLDNPQTSVKFEEKNEPHTLSQQEELLIFRMIQELINNALKHAEASEIAVYLDWGKPLTIVVTDDGKGFNLEEIRGDIKKGVGLYSIENRASLIGGDVEFKSEPGTGSTVKIIIKKEHEQDQSLHS
ncbi:two-component sensor histidine kinase of extracellular degradative enzyme, putative [Fulvivirga imtechensis AK7]|uniref:histidine kinase n=1 Tax=Fulvivirga imtechensis AK7 TaxID=1237149 RepID=L8JLB0_9BACT|nr:sensor histidine kinase [Fulvivirga imtechensis]ELR69033.1 two-component sensor histidine kinase of extracellular degradative enzyme, putative [Fulvivirga imtechensis AK7]